MTSAVPGSHGMRAQRVGVGQQHHVAVPLLPARHRVAVDGVHVDVDRQQVVAGLRAVRQHLLLEEARRHALADEAPLRVGEGDDHGVDLAGRDRGVQLRDAEVPWHPSPSLALCAARRERRRPASALASHCNHEVRLQR